MREELADSEIDEGEGEDCVRTRCTTRDLGLVSLFGRLLLFRHLYTQSHANSTTSRHVHERARQCYEGGELKNVSC